MSTRAALALVLACTACARGDDGPRTELVERYTDPHGWRITFPEEMHVERWEAKREDYAAVVTVASFEPRSPILATGGIEQPLDESGRFPDDGVAFRMVFYVGNPHWQLLEEPESIFPLRLRDFERGRAFGPSKPLPRNMLVVANGRPYLASAYVGREASPELRRELAEIVSSLWFPPTRTGTTVAGLTVLEEASAYPVGSFTRVRHHGRPMYLVHAPGGFYGVGGHESTGTGDPHLRCPVQLDRRRLEFVCPSLGARWDRLGRVVVPARDAVPHDRLRITIAKVSHDGRVLLSGHPRHIGANDAKEYWPVRSWKR